MASDYIPLRTALCDERKFPKGICPLMSRMQVVMMPVPPGSANLDPHGLKVVQQETFLPAPCIGDVCALWDLVDGGCKIRKASGG